MRPEAMPPLRGERSLKTKPLVAVLLIGGVIVVSLIALFRPAGPSAGVSFGAGTPVVAVVRIDGTLVTGSSSATSVLSNGSAGSDTIVGALAEARTDPSVKAVVLRMNSPGGSPAAAQEVSEELAALRAEGKIVVTSMGDVAASGAYWIAANTDHIMADAGTLTGSIGVIWELPNYQGLYEKLGISYITFTSGPYKDMGSPSRPMTAEEESIMRAMVDDMYNQFVDTVAAGRKMPREKVLALADGRVFTGSQAAGNGLVDSLGGLQKAIGKAAELAGIAGDYRVWEMGRLSPWELLLGEARSLIRELRLGLGLYGTPAAGGANNTYGEGPK